MRVPDRATSHHRAPRHVRRGINAGKKHGEPETEESSPGFGWPPACKLPWSPRHRTAWTAAYGSELNWVFFPESMFCRYIRTGTGAGDLGIARRELQHTGWRGHHRKSLAKAGRIGKNGCELEVNTCRWSQQVRRHDRASHFWSKSSRRNVQKARHARRSGVRTAIVAVHKCKVRALPPAVVRVSIA